jgi:ATP-dependent DNA helicase RecQ
LSATALRQLCDSGVSFSDIYQLITDNYTLSLFQIGNMSEIIEKMSAYQQEVPLKALKKYFGYDGFRPMQEEIIQTIYEGRDALVLMPTGGGKSICFQIPAVTMPGVCVVVSPLIALMKDQVEGLKSNGIPAEYMNTSQTAAELRKVENLLMEGKLKLLYVSPEKLVSQNFMPLLRSLNINSFAIDEAHCVSSWGHDFRPEYMQMQFLKQQFPQVPVIALTATADRVTRKDIVEQLKMQDPAIFISSFDRPNLSLEVRPGQKRIEQIVDFVLNRPNKSGIIYCLSRKSTEQLAEKLQAKGVKAEAYHGMMPTLMRSKVQEDFINDRIQIVCATIAFGMGIDKSNVRWVIHYNLPKNIEGYYQEIGRSGRDGEPAETILFYSYQDVSMYRDMFQENDSANLELQLAKLDRMMNFAEAQVCRRKILLSYFSEPYEQNCGNCDVCTTPPKQIDGTTVAQMALSAITRLKEGVALGILIDVLRGSGKAEVLTNGYDKIKTYGAGRMYKVEEWVQYIWQLIQMGYLEIAYDDKHKLKLTESSKAVLFEGKQVSLVRPILFGERMEQQKEAKKEAAVANKKEPSFRNPRPERVTVSALGNVAASEELRMTFFEFLRDCRKTIAVKSGVPPYVVFSDATLRDITLKLPTTSWEMQQITGIGEQKMATYGATFMSMVQEFVVKNAEELGAEITPGADADIPAVYKMSRVAAESKPQPEIKLEMRQKSEELTFQLYRAGMTIEDIAEKRLLSPNTVSSHLNTIYEQGKEEMDIHEFISQENIVRVVETIADLEQPYKLKEIFDRLGGDVTYDAIRWGISFDKKMKN